MAETSQVSSVDFVGKSRWYKGWDVVQSYFSSPIRDKWGRKVEYVFTCLGYCIGFGNIWRFPYVVHKNGGAAFFLPYVFVLLVMALPIFYLEALLGQFSGCNPISAYNFAPALKGIGFSTLVVCSYCSIYYIMLLVYSSRYFFQSFSYDLPWTKCRIEWGPNCYERKMENSTYKRSNENKTTSSEYYWQYSVLHWKDTSGEIYSLDNIGTIQWDLFGLLLLSWFIQYLFLFRGIKFSGKIVCVTATFPFVVLIALFLFTLTMEGATDGLNYLFVPNWRKILEPAVWQAVTTQAFYSTGIGYGCHILYSSYNEFQFPIQSIAVTIVFFDLFASFCSSMTVFSALGYLAKRLNIDISNVVDQGPGLVFIIMPEAISNMPLPQLWTFFYFLMLYTVGIDSQAAMVDNVITCTYEEIPKLRKHKGKVRIIVCIVFFLLSIPCTTNAGIDIINFLDTFSAHISLTIIALLELTSLMFIYGYKNFFSDIHYMTGRKVNIFWIICWLAIVPIVLLILIGISIGSSVCAQFTPEFCTGGWILAVTCLIPIPLYIVIYTIIYYVKGKWQNAFKPERNWGPRDDINRLLYIEWQRDKETNNLNNLLSETNPEFPAVAQALKLRMR